MGPDESCLESFFLLASLTTEVVSRSLRLSHEGNGSHAAFRRSGARTRNTVRAQLMLALRPACFLLSAADLTLERDPGLHLEGSRCDEMCAAKRREKVVQRNPIRDVHDRESQADFVAISSEQIVGAGAEIE